ncbi:hypothetical protein C8Q75DRAFT_312049 [Abortiporus biennis]|nr:hypothetical protein C8Q75DRAFT_312049 [Abortiporus biennis]
MGIHQPLPPAFTSLYRIFLRSISAAVLHTPRATRSIRQLYRQSFAEAASVIRRLQSCPESQEATQLEQWLTVWQQRADNTLSILYNAATSRGSPHRLISNLSNLHRTYLYSAARRPSDAWTWNGQLSRTSVEYQPKVGRDEHKNNRKKEPSKIENRSWVGLSEIIAMAEGRDKVLLGRVLEK